MTTVISIEEKLKWANEQIKVHAWNLKHGDKFNQIQAKVKLETLRTLTEEEFKEIAIASYDAHQDFIHNRNYK